MPALSLSPAERSALRSEAHALKPVVLIGAEGLTDAVLAEIEVHLAAHQLIKIRVFGDERDERVAIYDEICDRLNAAPIQHIGKLLVIWKPEQAEAAPQRGRRGVPSARAARRQGGQAVAERARRAPAEAAESARARQRARDGGRQREAREEAPVEREAPASEREVIAAGRAARPVRPAGGPAHRGAPWAQARRSPPSGLAPPCPGSRQISPMPTRLSTR